MTPQQLQVFLVEMVGGDDPTNPDPSQMAIRALVVYGATLLIIRLGARRLFGKFTAFDIILTVVLGSILSRAINGGASLTATLGAGVTLIALHWLLAFGTFHSRLLGRIFKGSPQRLVDNGEPDWDKMRRHHITQNDLEEALRKHIFQESTEGVEAVVLERDGSLGFLKDGGKARVVEVEVSEGVQRVRIEIR